MTATATQTVQLSKRQLAKQMYEQMLEDALKAGHDRVVRKDLIAKYMKEIGLTEAGAQTYAQGFMSGASAYKSNREALYAKYNIAPPVGRAAAPITVQATTPATNTATESISAPDATIDNTVMPALPSEDEVADAFAAAAAAEDAAEQAAAAAIEAEGDETVDQSGTEG